MPRKKKVPLPKAGDVFAFPLEDGRYSVCRVLIDREMYPKLSIDAILVVGSSWIGNSIPAADDPGVGSILLRTHHTYDVEPLALWVEAPLPADFRHIGTIEPTEAECQPFYNWPSHGHWLLMQAQPLLQWRWDHDREAVLAEDAERKRKQLLDRAQAQNNREEYLQNITLADLADDTFFKNWSHPPEKATEASRRVMLDTVAQLSALPKRASKKKRRDILKSCIEQFNRLDAEYEFIETVEREEICAEFEAIVHACGLGELENLADEWRDW